MLTIKNTQTNTKVSLRELSFREIVKRQFETFCEEHERPEIDVEIRRQRHGFAMNAAYGAFYLSPVQAMLQKGCRVLDIGCGIGIWVITLAKLYPKSKFVGVDLVNMYPSKNLPPNVEFLEHDVLCGLPFKARRFDFVNVAFMFAGIPPPQWLPLLKEISRVMTPGGWLETREWDIRLHPTHIVPELSERLINMFRANGLEPSPSSALPERIKMMEDFGLCKVTTSYFPVTSNNEMSWEYSKYVESLQLAIAQLKQPLTKNGLSADRFDELLADYNKKALRHKLCMRVGRFSTRKL